MPKRVIDFDAMWGSDKLASCAEWAQAEYAWLYGLADASGCFELTNLRVIWGRVAAIRRNLTIERLEQVFGEFQDKGLLFVWEHEGKRYGHWTGSDVPGRLPPPSWRMRLERLAPPVPKKLFAEYVSRFARGRAALAGGGFRGEAEREGLPRKFESSDLRFEMSGPKSQGPNAQFESSDLKFEMSKPESQSPDATFGSSDLKYEMQEPRAQRPARKCESSDLRFEIQEPRAQRLDATFGNLDLKFEISDLRSRGMYAGTQQHPNLPQQTGQNLRLTAERQGALKGGLEESQAQDWNWDREMARGRKGEAPDHRVGVGETLQMREILSQPPFSNTNSKPETAAAEQRQDSSWPTANRSAHAVAAGAALAAPVFRVRDKSSLVAGELLVGRGPSCGPGKVRPEVLERIRAREAARKGSRSP